MAFNVVKDPICVGAQKIDSQNWLLNFIHKWWLLKEPVFLWFIPLIRKRGDDIKLISVATSIGIKSTDMFGKLFSFD